MWNLEARRMEVHHYDYYAVANAPHRAAGERADGRRVPAASSALSFAKLTAAFRRRNEAAA
ncbi:hypothetical protein PBS_23650 [Paraburkholderia sp. 2C]